MAQLDFGHIFSLYLVNAEADHQVGYDLGLLGRVAHDLNGLVNVEQNRLQALEQMQTLLLALQVVVGAAAHTLGAEGNPLQQNAAHTQHLGLARDQHIEVAGKAVLQGRGLIQAGHQLVGVLAALEVDGQLQTVEVGLVAHVGDLTDLAELDQLGDLVHDGLDRCCGRDAGDINAVVRLVVAPLGADADTAAAVFQHILHLGGIVQDRAAAHKVRRGDNLPQISLRVFHQGDRCIAELLQIEGADVGCHADRDAQRIVGQNCREGDGQQRRFGRRAVIVRHKVDGVLVDVAEQLVTNRLKLGLGITGGGIGHIAAVRLAEVTLGVHERHKQALVGAAHADHRVVDGCIAVGVQVHRTADDVGAFGTVALQQAHLVHRVEQLAVGRLEAIDLRQRAGNDNAHRIGHIVGFQRVGDGRFQHLTRR